MADGEAEIQESGSKSEDDPTMLVMREFYKLNSEYVIEMVDHFLSNEKSQRTIGDIFYKVLRENQSI